MNEYIFRLPDLGEGTVESEIGEWFIKVGDPIKEEDVIEAFTLTEVKRTLESAPLSS